MKVAYCSDLHMEFSPLELKNSENAKVLLLAGDVSEVKHFSKDFFDQCSHNFDHVVYVAGNHEFYDNKWEGTLDKLRELCENYPNVYFMENNLVTIEGVLFIGATLWTDCNKSDPLTLYHLKNCMADYFLIRDDSLDNTRLIPATTVERHKKTIQYIKTTTKSTFR